MTNIFIALSGFGLGVSLTIMVYQIWLYWKETEQRKLTIDTLVRKHKRIHQKL